MSAAAIRTALRAIYPPSTSLKVTAQDNQIVVTVPVGPTAHSGAVPQIVTEATGGKLTLTGAEDYRHNGSRRRYTFTPTSH